MINEIEKENAHTGISNIQTQNIDKYTDVSQSAFDFVFLIDVLHMMDGQKDVIEYFLQKINPKGKILAKFEHMNKKEIMALLKSVKCIYKVLDNKDWWILKSEIHSYPLFHFSNRKKSNLKELRKAYLIIENEKYFLNSLHFAPEKLRISLTLYEFFSGSQLNLKGTMKYV